MPAVFFRNFLVSAATSAGLGLEDLEELEGDILSNENERIARVKSSSGGDCDSLSMLGTSARKRSTTRVVKERLE